MKLQNPILLHVALAWLAFAASASAQATLLFKDDFNSANGNSLTDPTTRATGTLASTVKYAWTDTTQVVANGTLNWDANNDRNGQHQQTDSGATSQNFRMTYNWAPQVGFDLKNQKAYRLHKSGNLTDWTLWEDFGVIAGDHQVTLPLTTDKNREFYKIEAYQP